MMYFGTQVPLFLADLDPPGRSRREPMQMEEVFHQCLVLGGQDGVIALLIHQEHLYQKILPKCITV